MLSSCPYGYQSEWPFLFIPIFKIEFENKQAFLSYMRVAHIQLNTRSQLCIFQSFTARETVKPTDQGR